MPLLEALASSAMAICSDLYPQAWANIAWAFAFMLLCHTPLLSAISSAALTKLSDFGQQELANIAWSFAKLE